MSTDGMNSVPHGVRGVYGVLMKVVKWVPTVEHTNMHSFFPGGLEYSDASIRDSINKRL
jgi:hypothetical protein